jgi:alanine racemase
MESIYHRVYAKVNLDAIRNNLTAIREYVNYNMDHEVKVMAVVKADGYGHGAIPISRELEKLHVDYIAVAIYQEGIQLREEGVSVPILVLGNTHEEAFEELVRYNLTQTVYSIELAQKLNYFGEQSGKKVRVHVKVDTGMGRLGFRLIGGSMEQSVEEILQLTQYRHLECEGLFTHFSKADEVDISYTNMQVDLFEKLLGRLEAQGITFPLIHASNSAGLIDHQRARFNMVRAGIALYGLYPSDTVSHAINLQPALSISSHIIFLKNVEKDEYISYGGIFKTSRPSKIATVPIGYADGYSRALSNKGRVLIRGQYAPVVGRVCMDQMLVDVTDIEGVTEDDEVVLIGASDGQHIFVEELARHMNTINYEVICSIGKRVPRIYMKENEVVETIDYF